MKTGILKVCLCTLALGTMLLSLGSCSSEVEDLQEQATGWRTCRMRLVGGIATYNEPGTRAALKIADGTCLYVTFDGKVNGTATYSLSANEWQVEYDKALNNGNGSCRLYYFTGIANGQSVSTVQLSPTLALYGTEEGRYMMDSEGNLTVTATLNPTCSRVRFKGTKGQSVQIKGARYAKTYSTTSGSIAWSSNPVTLTVGQDYTNYLYYNGVSSETLELMIDGKTYTMPTPLQKQGTGSGYIILPTPTDHTGWTMQ